MGRNASLSSPLVPQRSPVCLVPDLSPFPKTFAGNLECRQCRCFIAADTKKTACSSPFVGAHLFSKFTRKLFQKEQGFSLISHLLETLRRIQIKSDISPVQIVDMLEYRQGAFILFSIEERFSLCIQIRAVIIVQLLCLRGHFLDGLRRGVQPDKREGPSINNFGHRLQPYNTAILNLPVQGMFQSFFVGVALLINPLPQQMYHQTTPGTKRLEITFSNFKFVLDIRIVVVSRFSSGETVNSPPWYVYDLFEAFRGFY